MNQLVKCMNESTEETQKISGKSPELYSFQDIYVVSFDFELTCTGHNFRIFKDKSNSEMALLEILSQGFTIFFLLRNTSWCLCKLQVLGTGHGEYDR